VGKRLVDDGRDAEKMLQCHGIKLYPIWETNNAVFGCACCGILGPVGLDLNGVAIMFVTIVLDDSSNVSKATRRIPTLSCPTNIDLAS
jgi:hypothetical protein